MVAVRNLWTLTRAASSAWVDDYAQSMGAALAYYTMFSIAPLLWMVISVAGLIFGVDAARGEIVGQLQGLMGRPGAEALQAMLLSASKPAESIAATVMSGVLLLVGATSVFAELQDALDRIWRAPKRVTGGVWNLLRTRVLSFGMIMCIGFLLMVSLVLSAGLAALSGFWGPLLADWETLASVANIAFGFVLSTSMFALIYKIMPRVAVAWSDVAIGAVVTAVLFTAGKTLIGLYIGRSGVTSGFGAAGSLVVSLVWVYYSAQIFLLGAEFTWAYALTFGSRSEQTVPAAAPLVPGKSTAARPEKHMAAAKRAAAAEGPAGRSGAAGPGGVE
jgi:membrane protein